MAGPGDDVLTVGDVPHALLFPRLAAVVHHACAGTSAAALRAEVPSVPVPVTADQPFWAARLAALGAATDPVPFRHLTAERLAGALSRAVGEPGYARAAATAAAHTKTEDGCGPRARSHPAGDRRARHGVARGRFTVPRPLRVLRPRAGRGPPGAGVPGAPGWKNRPYG